MSLRIQLIPITKTTQGKTYKDINCADIDENPVLTDLQAIKNRIRNIFDWRRGSRILYPNFGNVIDYIKYEPLNELTLMNAEKGIREMFSYEPEVTITNITMDPNPDENELYIRVDYSVPRLNVTTSTEFNINVVEQ